MVGDANNLKRLARFRIFVEIRDHDEVTINHRRPARFSLSTLPKTSVEIQTKSAPHRCDQHRRDANHSSLLRIRPPKKTVTDALRPFDSEQRKRAANRLPTRQIANAMAGVPKLKWRTSLDKCSERPSSYRVGHNAAGHYRAKFGMPEKEAEFGCHILTMQMAQHCQFLLRGLFWTGNG